MSTNGKKAKQRGPRWHTTSEFALVPGLFDKPLTLVVTDLGPGSWEWSVSRAKFIASGKAATQEEARAAALAAANKWLAEGQKDPVLQIQQAQQSRRAAQKPAA